MCIYIYVYVYIYIYMCICIYMCVCIYIYILYVYIYIESQVRVYWGLRSGVANMSKLLSSFSFSVVIPENWSKDLGFRV